MAQSSEARDVKKAREADDGARRELDASERADAVTIEPTPADVGSATAQEAASSEGPRDGGEVDAAAATSAGSEVVATGMTSEVAATSVASDAAATSAASDAAATSAASDAAATSAASKVAATSAASDAAATSAASKVAATSAASDAAATSAANAVSAPLESLSLRDEPIPRAPPAAVGGPWRSYKEILATLAQRVLDAQRPIRILQALRWDAEVEEQFLRSKQRELPRVSYSDDLGFDPEAKLREIEEILRDAERELGKRDRLGQILRATADEYRRVVRMLMGRGTKEFYTLSRELYGSPKDKFPDGKTSVRDMGFVLYDLLTAIGGERLGPPQAREITAEMAALELNARFDRFFGGASIRVQVDDSLLADAAAGSDYVKIRSGAIFSKSDIDILEAHEGWVHVATSLNGQAQPVARWLAKGPPRTTAVQEGLAVLLEILTFRSTPRRAKKLNDRILAVDKAEDGASFLDVFEWYRTEGYDEEECFQNARRVFRGGLLEGGAPFTKDACYCKGIVLNYAFMRAAIQHDRAMLIPFLFVGKVAHEDVPVLYAHLTDGIVRPPPYLPPLFDDMNGLAIWICYSSFFSRLGGTAIAEHYGRMLNH